MPTRFALAFVCLFLSAAPAQGSDRSEVRWAISTFAHRSWSIRCDAGHHCRAHYLIREHKNTPRLVCRGKFDVIYNDPNVGVEIDLPPDLADRVSSETGWTTVAQTFHRCHVSHHYRRREAR